MIEFFFEHEYVSGLWRSVENLRYGHLLKNVTLMLIEGIMSFQLSVHIQNSIFPRVVDKMREIIFFLLETTFNVLKYKYITYVISN